MINYQQARAKINTIATNLPTITLPIEQALNFTCAETIVSPEYLPSFHNSAMDGYAIRSEASKAASEKSPLSFDVIGCVGAGDSIKPSLAVLTNTAFEIMTGAPIPEHYDAVIRLEDVVVSRDVSQKKIAIHRPVNLKENVRALGEDFKKDEPMLSSGEVIKPRHIMALAAVGISQIVVSKKPRIVLLCTGRELVDNAETDLKYGQIRNSNAPYLKTMLSLMGAELQHDETIPDKPEKFSAMMQNLLSHAKPPDIILSTGGVSTGRWDFIPDSLKTLGIETIFHKVKLRPGKPVLFARFNETYFFGLPGNPISAAVGLRFFVYPLIRKLVGLSEEKPLTAVLNKDYSKKPGLRFFAKGSIRVNSQGQIEATVLQGQESFKINPLLSANCWIEFNDNMTHAQVGDIVNTYPLNPSEGFF